MKCIVSTACVLSVLVVACLAAPFLPSQFSASTNLQVGGAGGSSTATTSSAGGLGGLTNILSDIDLPGLLRSANSIIKVIGLFCPPLSQVLDNVLQNVTSTAFRVFGRLILRSGGLGGSSTGGDGGQRVNVVLPTFPPDEDEDYDDDENDKSERPTSSTDADVDLRSFKGSNDTTTTTATEASDTVSPANEANEVAKRHVRVARDVEEDDDQDEAESAPQPVDDLSNVDDADRNKRFLPFGGGVSAHGSHAGSGNFLFDLIRNTADRAARTVGTVYRMVAGTENVGWGLTTTAESTQTSATGPLAKLVAGSGATEESDEKANSPGGLVEVDVAKGVASGHGGDGYTEGIPGPITRLFVIANRGIANLVQDLILRLAQTSERLVNFKARLVTSLI